MHVTRTRRRKLKRDPKGYFRPYVGWAIVDGKRVQPRFNLGKDEREAGLRYAQIQKLYEESSKAARKDIWTDEALHFARQIEKGQTPSFGTPHEQAPHIFSNELEGQLWHARWIDRLQADHPSITIKPEHPAAFAESVRLNKEFVADRIKQLHDELKVLGALVGQASFPDKLVEGTWHEALDAYKAHIDKTGDRLENNELKAYQRKRKARAEAFKALGNFPLYELTRDKCDEIVGHWRNRPNTTKGTPCSPDDARHNITELFAIWKWLDATHSFGWTMPNGTLLIKRKVKQLAGDDQDGILNKHVYSPEELATISSHATDRERLLLLVGLNCAMGAAELGRLVHSYVLFNHKHEFANRLNFTSTDEDSFIRCFRPKTGVFGEWLLWPETAEALKGAIERAKKPGSQFVFTRDSGKPLYNEFSMNPQAAFANAWDALIKRVQKQKEGFRKLPFGTLRDTLPDMLRQTHSDELASLCVSHGSPTKSDKLLDCYGTKPYGRLHEAIRELRQHFSQVLQPQKP